MKIFTNISGSIDSALAKPKTGDLSFILFSMLMQLVFIFQGVDLADSGFNATFYQQFFDHPVSVEYNFMFWLTGVIGATFYKLFGSLGLWGIRFLGVLVNTTTVYLSYRLLKRHIPRLHAFIGLMIVLLWLNNDIKELNYNSLSALMNVSIIAFLYHGCIRQQGRLLVLAGLFCALNTFVRLPNILTLGMVTAILLNGLMANQSISRIVKSSFLFFAGFTGGVLVVLTCMKFMGHLEHYRNATAIVLNLASGKSAQNAMENSYGAITLIKQCIYQTLLSVNYAVYMGIYLLLIYALNALGGKMNARFRWMPIAVSYGTYLVVILLFAKQSISYGPFLVLFSGLGIVFSLPWLLHKEKEGMQLLAFLGLFLLLYYPFGSSYGIYTAGRYSFWIALPLGLSYILQFKQVQFRLALMSRNLNQTIDLSFSEKYFNICKRVLLAFSFGSGLYFSYHYPFFDRKDRLTMTHGVKNPHLKWIYTSEGRANAVNELFDACAIHTRPGDLVLAYDDIPMVHFATETVPFLHNSMPWLYPANIFAKDLKESFAFYQKAPIIVKQKVKTFGDAAGWPEVQLPEPYENWDVNKERNRIMNEFMLEHQYTEVWSSPYFSILKPGNAQ